MTDPMLPADVPDSLVLAAANVLLNADDIDGDGTAELREILAVVLPLHKQQVRVGIAAELRAVTFHCPTHDSRPKFDPRCVACQRYAALVGAERLVAGHESPSAKAVRELRQTQAEAVVILDGLKED